MPGFCEDHGRRHLDRYECGEMYRAEAAAARDAANRARAERIAAEQIDGLPFALATSGHLARITEAITAAALQALTEKENAR